VYLNALHHEADVVGFSILVEIYNINNNNNNIAITGALPTTPKFTISFPEEQPPPTWSHLLFVVSVCYTVIMNMIGSMWSHVTIVWGKQPADINGACNAADYEAGLLTRVCLPAYLGQWLDDTDWGQRKHCYRNLS
jgi:hypothetical protein